MPRIKYPPGEEPRYAVERDGALWRVYDARRTIQFTSLKRINCTDWVQGHTPRAEREAAENAAFNAR